MSTSTSSTSSTSFTSSVQTSSSSAGTLSFIFLNASASFDSASGQTTIHVALRDTGSINILPKYILNVVPSGTSLVPGTWTGDFYSSSGVYLCSVPHGCNGGPPDTSNGGTILITFQVTGATPGETLTLSYTITENGLTATGSTNILVA
ncbi:MAG TPA: hypothetical protein VFE91_04755 [Nitrososphaerales archaeon]|nr:hypothetical protein [Nitrososphaerales archaeon]